MLAYRSVAYGAAQFFAAAIFYARFIDSRGKLICYKITAPTDLVAHPRERRCRFGTAAPLFCSVDYCHVARIDGIPRERWRGGEIRIQSWTIIKKTTEGAVEEEDTLRPKG